MPAPDLITLFIAPLNALGLSYMVTGAVAAVVYGEPRFTRDVDLVVSLRPDDAPRLAGAFPAQRFYVPPPEVIAEESRRARHGHFNLIHLDTSLKADFYPTGDDPLHGPGGWSGEPATTSTARRSGSPHSSTSWCASWRGTGTAAPPATWRTFGPWCG